MHKHTRTVPNPRLAWCFWPLAQCLGCVSACVFMYFKAVLFRMQAGRESSFTADKSIWLISFCPRPPTRSACLCVCVCLTQSIEVRGAPGGRAGDGDWHQPSASSVTKLVLRDRRGGQWESPFGAIGRKLVGEGRWGLVSGLERESKRVRGRETKREAGGIKKMSV